VQKGVDAALAVALAADRGDEASGGRGNPVARIGRDVGGRQDPCRGLGLVEACVTADRGAQWRGRRQRGGEHDIHGGPFSTTAASSREETHFSLARGGDRRGPRSGAGADLDIGSLIAAGRNEATVVHCPSSLPARLEDRWCLQRRGQYHLNPPVDVDAATND
jgi:hypothetical protein